MSNIQLPEGPPAGASPMSQQFPPLLKNRNFLLLWAGYVVSSLGDRIHWVVMLELLCVKLLGLHDYPSREAARLNIFMFLPFFVLGPITGILADRFPRRMLMVFADLTRFAVVIGARTIFLAKSNIASTETLITFLYGSEIILAAFGAIFSPARSALLPNLVHPNQLLRANSMTNAAGTIFSLVGFVVAGLLIKFAGLQVAMYADAATYLLSATFLMFMRLPKGRAMAVSPGNPSGNSYFKDFEVGIRYLLRHRRAMQIILLLLVFWSTSAVILNGIPAIVTNDYSLSSDFFTDFMALAGVGMILGAAAVSQARQGIPKEVGIAWSMVLVGVCLFFVTFTGGHGSPGHPDPSWKIGLFWIIGAAFFGAVLLVSLETLLQRILPDFVRGRVMGVKDLVTNVGLIGAALPLALARTNAVDKLLRFPILFSLGIAVALLGVFLVILYYRNQTLPLPAAILRRIISAYCIVWHRFERHGACTVPGEGPVIVAANHTSAVDPLLMQVASRRRMIRFMMAQEYYNLPLIKYVFKWLGCIPVNRTGSEIASVRSALRTLEEGHVIGLYPEGKITMTGELQEAHPGIAMLILMSGATVVPAYICRSTIHQTVAKDILQPYKSTIRFGAPMKFGHLKGQEKNKPVRQQVTEEIMAAIRKIKARESGDQR